MSNKGSKYIKRELKELKHNLIEVGEGFSKKDIHRLRVSIKKIKALSELTEAIFPMQFDSIEPLLLFKKVFKNAGRIREADLNTDFLESLKLPHNLIKVCTRSLQDKKRKAYRALERNLKHFNYDKLDEIEKEILVLYSEILDSELRREGMYFIARECEVIKQLRAEKLTVPALHQIRKHLKKLAAISTLLNKVKPEQKLTGFIVELKGTEELIGEWHDEMVLRNSLKDFMSDVQNQKASEKRAVQEVLNKINAKNGLIIKKLKSKINATLQLM